VNRTGTEHPPGALDGVRVVEIAGVVLGPYACQLLGDLGADVIKIEPPAGDAMRQVGPDGGRAGQGPLFTHCNRNKRSVSLDLKQPAGRAAAIALIRDADVLVHNFRPSAIGRLGLAYADLVDENPDLIYCGTFGYGSQGPYGDRGAFDDSIQAASGLADLQGEVTGEVRFLPTIVADKTTALMVAQAVLAALFHRERSGQGQEIEVPMLETMAGWVAVEHLWGLSWEPAQGEAGYPRILSRWRRPYRTADDRWLSLLPYMNSHWAQFCTLSGHPELAADERFAGLQARLQNIDACYAAMERVVAERTLPEWLSLLGDTNVPLVAVNSVADLLQDEHLSQTGFWQEFDQLEGHRLRMPTPAASFSATPAAIRRLPPDLGQHSRELLLEAGLAGSEIDQMLEDGVLVEPPVKSDG
jgi:crotonobetainyl-CoA:carnitine CoA-transferase CaiB-like acyl-CoA transferase